MRKEYPLHKFFKIFTILVLAFLIFNFILVKEFSALYFLIPFAFFFVFYVFNYKYILTDEYFAIPILPYLWYWKIKNQDILEICEAKDYQTVFKKYYPNKRVLNKPFFGACIFTKSPLTSREIGIFPENAKELISDFKQVKL